MACYLPCPSSAHKPSLEGMPPKPCDTNWKLIYLAHAILICVGACAILIHKRGLNQCPSSSFLQFSRIGKEVSCGTHLSLIACGAILCATGGGGLLLTALIHHSAWRTHRPR